jgi:hypothetical protein
MTSSVEEITNESGNCSGWKFEADCMREEQSGERFLEKSSTLGKLMLQNLSRFKTRFFFISPRTLIKNKSHK